MALVTFVDDSAPYLNAQNLNKIHESNVYSTSEIEIGKYVDDKTIYKKTFTGSIADATILLSNVDVVINCYGTGSVVSGTVQQVPYLEIYNNLNYMLKCVYSTSTHNVTFAALSGGTPVTATNCNITIEYTKTTD